MLLFAFGFCSLGCVAFAIFFSRSSKAASSSSQPRARAASLNFTDWFLVGDGLVFGFMIFTVEDIYRLRAGWSDPITVGELPIKVAKEMGLLVPLVYLSKASLAHINYKHPDVTDYDLILVPFVVKFGLILRETRKPNVYLATYSGPHCPRRVGLAMKVAQPDREVYLESFYRLNKRQTRAWLNRCEIIKTYD